MDEMQLYGSVNIISVILGKSKGDIERLCSIKPHLQQKRLLPPARLEHMYQDLRHFVENAVHRKQSHAPTLTR